MSMPNTKEAITCAACEGTGHLDTDPRPCACYCHESNGPCSKCSKECCTAMANCEICDGEGMLDFGMVKYWFDQSQQMSTRVHQEQLARIDAELELYHSQYEAERATRVRRAA